MRKFAFIIISSLVSFIGVYAQIRINSIRVAYPLYVASFIDTSMVESLRKAISISNAPFEFQKDSIYILEQEPYYELIRERTYGIVDYHKKSNKNNPIAIKIIFIIILPFFHNKKDQLIKVDLIDKL